jgi:hypothetical protein
MNYKQPHKTIGRDTPWLTYVILTRIAEKEAKRIKRKRIEKQIRAKLKGCIEKLIGILKHV